MMFARGGGSFVSRLDLKLCLRSSISAGASLRCCRRWRLTGANGKALADPSGQKALKVRLVVDDGILILIYYIKSNDKIYGKRKDLVFAVRCW